MKSILFFGLGFNLHILKQNKKTNLQNNNNEGHTGLKIYKKNPSKNGQEHEFGRKSLLIVYKIMVQEFDYLLQVS